MLVGDADDGNQKNLEEIIEKISINSFSKYSLSEDQVISKGKSIFDVIQDKLIEFLKRNRKPEANPENDSQWFHERVNQGKRKLYKTAENIDSIDEVENFNPKYLARDDNTQSNLEKYQIIQKILSNYNARNKLIVSLRYFEELGDEEIAERAGTTKVNVRKIARQFIQDCSRAGIKFSKNRRGEHIGGKNNGG